MALWDMINPFSTSGLVQPYHLDESILIISFCMCVIVGGGGGDKCFHFHCTLHQTLLSVASDLGLHYLHMSPQQQSSGMILHKNFWQTVLTFDKTVLGAVWSSLRWFLNF